MPSVETIYQNSVRPLPIGDQVKLADLIMENVNSESNSPKAKLSVLEILEAHPPKRVFKDASEVDKWLRAERDSWDD